MNGHSLPTQFAPAQRAATKRLLQQAAHLANLPLLRPLFDAIPEVILILNAERQIVFANQALFSLAHGEKGAAPIGYRPGEVLDCVHASENESGCGTTSFCKNCGAVQAALSSLDGSEDVRECRISLKNGDALDLQVFATPLILDGQHYSFFVLKDISHEKRRRMLEHVFFHDVLNSAGALRGLADVLHRAPLADKEEVVEEICLVSDRLIDEIKSQKELLAAENNELVVEHSIIRSRQLLEELIQTYHNHEAGCGRQVCLEAGAGDLVFISDRALLRRVLVNMITNALEASQEGQSVTLGCRLVKGQVEFWVHNPGYIPEEVRTQIFQRSFSTKGTGRGLGAYSIKLLGERYLSGKVSFTSSAAQGTRFRIRLPLE